MPAAAVIPAPTTYIKVVAVKKLVVEVSLLLLMAGVCASVPLPFAGRRMFAFSGHAASLLCVKGRGLL